MAFQVQPYLFLSSQGKNFSQTEKNSNLQSVLKKKSHDLKDAYFYLAYKSHTYSTLYRQN